MNIATIKEEAFTLNGVKIPETATKQEWMEIHRKILLAKRASGKWIKQSRDFAIRRWGLEFVADSEVQLEMDLGIAIEDEKPVINAKDKSTAFVTIEGISMQFDLWLRKVEPDIPSWDKPQLARALGLLEPIEKKAAEIRAALETAQK